MRIKDVSYNPEMVTEVKMRGFTFTHDWHGKWFAPLPSCTIYWGKTYWKLYLHFITVRITITRRKR